MCVITAVAAHDLWSATHFVLCKSRARTQTQANSRQAGTVDQWKQAVRVHRRWILQTQTEVTRHRVRMWQTINRQNQARADKMSTRGLKIWPRISGNWQLYWGTDLSMWTGEVAVGVRAGWLGRCAEGTRGRKGVKDNQSLDVGLTEDRGTDTERELNCDIVPSLCNLSVVDHSLLWVSSLLSTHMMIVYMGSNSDLELW